MMNVMHRLLHTSAEMTDLVERGLKSSDSNTIIDLCSGSGGPMPEVANLLESKGLNPKLIMTDLFPNKEFADKINTQESKNITYKSDPVDAAEVSNELKGLRTMVGSLHHMKPDTAKKILKNTMEARQPFLSFEISDNSYPKVLWWLAIPFNIISSLLVSAMARPYSFQQFFFTYLCPLIPITFAWDGAVSNARTYTLDDLDMLLKDLQSDDYTWKKEL